MQLIVKKFNFQLFCDAGCAQPRESTSSEPTAFESNMKEDEMTTIPLWKSGPSSER